MTPVATQAATRAHAARDPVKPARTQRLVAQARAETPLGWATLAATDAGLAGLWFDGQAHHPGPLAAPTDAGQRFIAQALEALRQYWHTPSASQPHSATAPARQPARRATAGFDVHFDVQLDTAGTPFQQAVWRALLHIAPGQTATYGGLAALIGHPRAVRAVGAAVGRNPVSIIVPCHRVIGRDGSLTGYAGGLERKRALLLLEGALTI
jgi:methylated-DNA-[protein]-cysteine S-methyltransferase